MSVKTSVRYQEVIKAHGYKADPAQCQVVKRFDALWHELVTSQHWLHRIFRKLKQPLQGIYCWGGVGRGKTFLMDIFYQSLPVPKKRLHFHRFMQLVHHQLKDNQGHKDPLLKIAKQWSKQTRCLCLDELFVVDIADAMILAQLLKHLFVQGVVLVTTTNIEPDKLYANGLQRDKFLPAIELIKQHCHIVHLDSMVDYRLRVLEQANVYQVGLEDERSQCKQWFTQLAPEKGRVGELLHVNDRELPTQLFADSIIWLDFHNLCKTPRSASDYIELARCYHTIIIHNVTPMYAAHEDIARRFITMIDEFYDRNVTLLICASVAIQDLYQGDLLSFEFDRTKSRLLEMQSHEYLSRPHLG